MSVAPGREPARVREMFGGIGHRYDLLNHLLSANLDRGWRRAAARSIPQGSRRLLDLCGGTGDLSLDLNRFRQLLSSRLEGVAGWQTEIFELRHFENLSIPEISARTNRSSDAVRSSLYRVKRLFFDAAAASSTSPAVVARSRSAS